MECQCGSRVRFRNVNAHLRTKKHIQWYNTLHCNMDGGPILALGPYKSVNLECTNCSHILKFDHYQFWCPECESNAYVDPDQE